MAIENELKYVLDLHREKDILKKIKVQKGAKVYNIRQGYIGDIRIRESKQNKTILYLFTFKQKVNNEVVEIETKISKDDFNKLWSVTTKSLTKTRVSFNNKNNEVWDIDFIKKDKKTYIVMAECEMPPGRKSPKTIPEFLKEYIVYDVPRGKKDFNNTQLVDCDHVTSLLISMGLI